MLKKKKLQLQSLKEKKKQQELHLAAVLSYLGTLYSCWLCISFPNVRGISDTQEHVV